MTVPAVLRPPSPVSPSSVSPSSGSPSSGSPPSPWPRRLVLAATAVLVPLFLFGGTVTTIGAGLAVEGWWNAEGHFMPFFPIEKWFRDLHTFVEHGHRQLGMVIGLLMLAACAATFRTDRRRSARVLVVTTTLAICVQGWLGGSRVLERSSELAFLHGAFAQAVFALLVATAAHQSRSWRGASGPQAPASDRDGAPPLAEGARSAAADAAGARHLRRFAIGTTALVYLQVVVGAWYRHGLRNDLGEAVATRLALHVVLAAVVFVAVVRLAGLAGLAGERARPRAASTGGAGAPGAGTGAGAGTEAGTGAGTEAGAGGERVFRAPLERVRRGLAATLLAQVLLGMLAWATHGGDRIGFAEWAFATLHVLVGAALLAHCLLAALWAGRGAVPAPAPVARPVEVTA